MVGIMIQYDDATYTRYALAILKGKKTLDNAQKDFGSNFNKLYNLYVELKKLKEAVDITKKLTDTGTKLLAITTIKQAVNKINEEIAKLKEETLKEAELFFGKSVDFNPDSPLGRLKLAVMSGYKAKDYSYKDWSIAMTYTVSPVIAYPDPGTTGKPYVDGLSRELMIEYWKENVKAKTYYKDDMYVWTKNGVNLDKLELESYLNQMLKDIGFADELAERQRQLQRNKGLQALALMIN